MRNFVDHARHDTAPAAGDVTGSAGQPQTVDLLTIQHR
jgi:hypothetical protein